MQYIKTVFYPPTDFKNSRVKAVTSSGIKHWYDWNDKLDIADNHAAAAKQLKDKMEWSGTWIGGSDNEGYVFVSKNSWLTI